MPRRTRMAGLHPSVGLSVWCQTLLAIRKRHIDVVLVEKLLPAAHPFSVLTSKAQGLLHSVILGRAAILGHEKMMVLRTARGRVIPFRREGIALRSRRTSYTHASTWCWSMSDISLSGEVVGLRSTTEGAVATGFSPVVAAFLGLVVLTATLRLLLSWPFLTSPSSRRESLWAV